MVELRNPGDAWVTAADGGRYWGRFGAAGLLVFDADRGVHGSILLQHRVTWSDHGDTWGIPGGARHEGESAVDGAIRESQEEAGVPDGAVVGRFTHVIDRGGWSYTTLVADVVSAFEPVITDPESHALAWVPVDEVEGLVLHPAFADSWRLLRPLLGRVPVVVVDAANVVGSVPDGWWRDRRAAAQRLCERVEGFVVSGCGVRAGFLGVSDADIDGISRAYPEWVVVVEGVARGVGSCDHVRTVDAALVGDDAIVAEVGRLAADRCLVMVVTSDVELKVRCLAAGAQTVRGARQLLKKLGKVERGG